MDAPRYESTIVNRSEVDIKSPEKSISLKALQLVLDWLSLSLKALWVVWLFIAPVYANSHVQLLDSWVALKMSERISSYQQVPEVNFIREVPLPFDYKVPPCPSTLFSDVPGLSHHAEKCKWPPVITAQVDGTDNKVTCCGSENWTEVSVHF